MHHTSPTPADKTSCPARFQVAIAGAGPAGSALALVLAGAGLSVLLLEQSVFAAARVGELLSPDAVHILCQMAPSLGQRLLGLALSVVSAWSGSELESHGDGSELPWRAVDRRELDRSLAEEAAARGARLITSARLAHPTWCEQGFWKLQVERQGVSEQFECDYLVDATGRASLVSRQLGAVRIRQSGQVAVVGFLHIPQGSDIPANMLLETTEDGWWYSAPLSQTDAVAVFITDDDLDKGPPEEAWRKALEASSHTRQRFASCPLKERPRRVAAGSSLLLPSFGKGWMAVGDAASCFDPLSVHGLGRALMHGAKVGEFLADCFSSGQQPNPVRLVEDNGEEFLKETTTLSVNYRRVRQWPNSVFWQRRDQGYPSVEVGRPKRRPRQQEPPLLFTDQLFACAQCGRCRRSSWPGERQTSADAPLEPLDFPIPLPRSSSCRFDTQNDPRACGQFPFLLRETPDGIAVGVSPLCRSVQSGQGVPLESHTSWIRRLIEDRPPPVLPRRVAVSWGRGIEWDEYRALEDQLLAAPDLEAPLRQLRWELSVWACDPTVPKFSQGRWTEPAPESFLVWLENLLVGSLLCCLEHDSGQNSSDLFGLLVDDRPVSFSRMQWTGRFSDLAQARQLQEIDELRAEVVGYQRNLLQRKFLAARAPMLHNLCLLSVLPNFLLTYSLLFSMSRGADRIENEDYVRALELVEMEVVTYGRLDELSHTIVGFHLESALQARRSTAGLETFTNS